MQTRNALINYQEMSSRQAVHIALSLPLHKSSRKTIFINTSPPENRILLLKSPKLLAKEKDDFENIMYASVVDKYIQRSKELDKLSLAEFTTFYIGNPSKTNKRQKSYIICYVKYNQHIDNENYCREKLMLYVSFRNYEKSLLADHQTWSATFSEKNI